MGVQMMTHTTNQSETRQVNVMDVWREMGAQVAPGEWWGVPVYVVREWITAARARDDHRTADAYVALVGEEPTAGMGTGVEYAPAPVRGVSLVKDTDRVKSARFPNEWAFESRRDPQFAVETLPGWVSRGLFRNSPCHLSEAFARLTPKTLAPRGLDWERETL